jgi:hypothetical protein
VQLVRFADGLVSEVVSFIGSEYQRGFGLPDRIAP